ncbi:lipid-A-disaccharide synthase [Gallibacterium genomosp. 3]|uniref:Lipid-A-disaccharide synthase n=1 Tax=Gallibacterium genomosp. 3 TaxID=505345 RepID=A0A1A7NPM3_9PAST|nr:lipid-A-disaccharide synthase [Gallibacterium genomosp. 3]OBW91578.1 lipid-A-disaccharide synthase [Gallibacterium genomosp. 3]
MQQAVSVIPYAPTIAIVAGEASGDILGAGLINALKIRYPEAKFIGIAGQKMLQAGCETLFDMEELSVMGLVEVIKHLPRLLKIRQSLIESLINIKPDIFIGIDAPDFNIGVELKLKQHGIKTLHYVSPSVWAWRQNRIHKIAQAVNMMLVFMPFEKAFYDQHQVPCRFIGHTLADALPLKPDRLEACEFLQIDPTQRYLAILVGSRHNEVAFLAETFIKTVILLQQQYPDIKLLVPLANQKRRQQFEQILQQVAPNLEVILIDGHAKQAMIVAEATLLASGTAALEAMLCKSPMVVGYKMKASTYWLAKRLVKTNYISLPNILANDLLVPEMIQEQCEPELLAEKLAIYFSKEEQDLRHKAQLQQTFTDLHRSIQQDADKLAAEAVVTLLESEARI